MKKFILPLICSSVLLLSACGEKGQVSDTNSVWSKVEQSTTNGTGSNMKPATPFSKDTQDIIKLQLKSPEALLKLDCNKYDEEGKTYCNSQKTKMEAHFNEVTWQKVLAKGDEYIKTFDCSTLVSTFGQKYCTEYQAKLAKAPAGSAAGE